MNKGAAYLVGLLLLLGSWSVGAATPKAAEDSASAVEVSSKPAPKAKSPAAKKAKDKAVSKAKKPKAKVARSQR